MSESSQNNVVRFSQHGKTEHGTNLIKKCSSIASEKLAKSLSTMMGLVDDTLFELAEKAENNNEQSHYFDAMRDVRLKRKNIENEFSKQLIDQCSFEDRPSTDQLDLTKNNELSLIEDNLLETSLAVSNMVAKANYLCKDELFALEQRIAHLLVGTTAEKNSNPLNPVNICNAFKEACNELDSDIKVKLIVLKLFEKYVIKDLKLIYQEINYFLAQNNILPVINYAIRNNATVETALNRVLNEPYGESNTSGVDLFSSLQELIRANSVGPAIAVKGQPASAGEIMNHLTMLQQGNSGNVSTGEAHIDPSLLLSGARNILRDLKTRNVFGEMSQHQDDTIDIVAMLFDYILDDKNIPDRMKALIGRLQIPILKVVLIDRTFFSKKRHPARNLLDTLSRAALGLNDEDDQFADAIYDKAEKVVQKILNDFDDDIVIFQELLTELDEFLIDISQQSEEKIEQARQEFEQQALQHNAGIIANKEVRKRIDTSDINHVVKEFLSEYWSKLLMMSYLKNAGDLESLQKHIDVMDKLIWSVMPKKTQGERRNLVEALPGLLECLNQGMDNLAMPAEGREKFYAELAQCHSRAVSTKSRSGVKKENAEQTPSNIIIESDATNLPDDSDVSSHSDDEHAHNKTAQEIAQATEADPEEFSSKTSDILAQFEQGNIEVEEITLSNSVEDNSLNTIEDKHTDLVRNMAKGSWISFIKNDGSNTHEKLLWINSVTEMYMFTNRNGGNTRNLSLSQFAEEIRAGRAEILEEEELIDRAVSNIVITLRRA